MTWGTTGLRVTFDDVTALDDITMTVAPGTVTAVVGGDGAGKTTLLRCLAGALASESGSVATPAKEAIGYLPASSGSYPDLSVAENLAFRATAYGMRGPAAQQRAAELTGLAGLSDVQDRLAGQLSGGMRQKLGVIAAMMHTPQLLVLDEPTTGVDPVSRSGLWLLITRAAADGVAVVLSTTYLDDAQRAGSVLALDAGRTLASGTPEEIIASVPGTVLTAAAQPQGEALGLAWRRAGRWRIWVPPPGRAPAGGEPVTPDLQDAVTVAALARELAQADSAAAGPHRSTEANEPRPAARSHEPPTGPLAECVSVTCRFGHFTAVRDVSLQIQPGEVVGLLGANGAGKTTLIRALLGLQPVSEGAVALIGRRPSRSTRARVGYVPQGLGLYDDLTATENMRFVAAAFGVPPAPLPDDFARLQNVPVGALPLGLQRRAAFAQALSHEPDLLILDEPTSGVDPLGRARLWDTIARSASRGAGVLVSTHYMEEAGECDRLIIMAAGEVVAAGTQQRIVGDAQVTVVEATDWAQAFSRLAAAGLPAALAGRTLRVPGVGGSAVRAALGGLDARLAQAPATLEERFFELVSRDRREPVPT
jgi:ABC-2 type transport system ATP-binding protein